MPFRRGFKAQANRIAVGLRIQLGLTESCPIDVKALAAHLRVAVSPLSMFAKACPDEVARLVGPGSSAFSACLVPAGDGRAMAIVNDAHSVGRQNSSLAHELAHSLLDHSPEAIVDCAGCRNFQSGKENEAGFLAGCILIPDEAARAIVRSGIAPDAAASRYGVSRSMLKYRLNVSGALIQHRRARRR